MGNIEITIELSEQLHIYPYRQNMQSILKQLFTIDNPEYEKKKRLGFSTYGTPKQLLLYYLDELGHLYLARGFLNVMAKALKNLGYDINIVSFLEEGKRCLSKWNTSVELRDYQKEVLSKALASNYGGCLVVPAGGGKTIIGMNLISRLTRKTLWITHTKDLMYQSRDNARFLLGIEPGIIGDSKREFKESGKNELLTIATVQTLMRNQNLIERLKDVGMIIVDEAHHVPSSVFSVVLRKFKCKLMYGLTATPDRKDGLQKLMYGAIGPKLIEIPRERLYKAKKLVIPELVPVYTEFDDSTACVEGNAVDLGGDGANWHGLVQLLTADEVRKDLIVETIVKNFNGKQTLVLSEWVEYAKKILIKLREKIPTGTIQFIHGGVSKKSREKIIQDFKEKKIKILLATKLAREGLDIPNLERLFLVTPKRGDSHKTRDGAALEQEVGRLMRPDPKNKDKKPIVYDFVDYENNILKSQWYSRRKVYKRLSINIPKKTPSKKHSKLNSMYPDLFD